MSNQQRKINGGMPVPLLGPQEVRLPAVAIAAFTPQVIQALRQIVREEIEQALKRAGDALIEGDP